jgi:hypothetical protein
MIGRFRKAPITAKSGHIGQMSTTTDATRDKMRLQFGQ